MFCRSTEGPTGAYTVQSTFNLHIKNIKNCNFQIILQLLDKMESNKKAKIVFPKQRLMWSFSGGRCSQQSSSGGYKALHNTQFTRPFTTGGPAAPTVKYTSSVQP